MHQSSPSPVPRTCWVLTEGIAGTENQCLGLADALGLDPLVKRIGLRAPWKQFSPWLPFCLKALAANSSPLAPPWPDLLIASGRKSIGAALYIKKKSGGKTFVALIQDPRFCAKDFDLVIVPQHDPLRGANVEVTAASLHRVTPAKLETARAAFAETFAHLPSPRIGVLIGGSSRAHTMDKNVTEKLAHQLDALRQNGAALMVTASRRTGEANRAILQERLSGENVFFWDGAGDNPYFGILAHADYIVVTEDSVSMTSEAISTGKPVFVAPLAGGGRRLGLFHAKLREQGFTRLFTGELEKWSYTPPNDTEKAAAAITRAMLKRKE